MNRFALSRRSSPLSTTRRGYTLVEILVATMLSLLILGAVVQLFAKVGTSINQSRAILEAAESLRHVQNLMQGDLAGATVTPIPPARMDDNPGYIEIIKGAVVQTQIGPLQLAAPNLSPLNTTSGPATISPPPALPPIDSSVGAIGNILMLTTRTKGKPFTGRFNDPVQGVRVVESDVAEVAWFLRGKNLHRRVLLVAPSLINPHTTTSTGFYALNDISVRWDSSDGSVRTNTLGDLTRRECRFAHPFLFNSDPTDPRNMPYDIRNWLYLGLPTLQECSDPGLSAGKWDSACFVTVNNVLNKHWQDLWSRRPDIKALANPYVVDFWSPEPIMNFRESALTNLGTRTSDDLVLTNVLSFDIKVWDPGYPILQEDLGGGVLGKVLKPGDAGYVLPGVGTGYGSGLKYVVLGFGGYVDLGYYPAYAPYTATGALAWQHALPCPPPTPNFSGLGNQFSPLVATASRPERVYDTWSNSYDNVPAPSTSIRPNDGFDNKGIGVVDNDDERAFPTPYSAPLRGIQVIIRIYEPDSRQIREVTIEQDFLPK
jgi:type II secretory pathway pseudopilin PulG